MTVTVLMSGPQARSKKEYLNYWSLHNHARASRRILRDTCG
jgi:hypothetical protein